jgi:hypothetical protein
MTSNPFAAEVFVSWFRTVDPNLRFLRSRIHNRTIGAKHRWPSRYDILDAEVVGVTFDSVGQPVRRLYLLVLPDVDDGCRLANVNPAAVDDAVGAWQGIKLPLGAIPSNHSPTECVISEGQNRDPVRQYWQKWRAKKDANRLLAEQTEAAAPVIVTTPAPPKPKRKWWQIV